MTSHSRPTIRQVAELAGVGFKTVSRVINGEPNVSEATAQKVWQAVEALDYHRDMRAGSLRRSDGRTHTIGLLVPSVDNPFAGEMHRGVELVASPRGVVVLAASLEENPERELAVLRDFKARHVDGIILNTTTNDPEHLAAVRRFKIPTVYVDRLVDQGDRVTSDNRTAAAKATRHLVNHGHRRIALLMERPSIPTAAERRDGFVDGLAEAGITNCPIVIVDSSPEAAYQAVTNLLRGPEAPTAIFSAQNMLSIGAIRALHAAQMHHKIAFVGFDDLPLGELLDPPMTAVRQDPLTIGKIAAQRLFERLGDDQLPTEHLTVPTTLMVRGSGEISPDADPA